MLISDIVRASSLTSNNNNKLAYGSWYYRLRRSIFIFLSSFDVSILYSTCIYRPPPPLPPRLSNPHHPDPSCYLTISPHIPCIINTTVNCSPWDRPQLLRVARGYSHPFPWITLHETETRIDEFLMEIYSNPWIGGTPTGAHATSLPNKSSCFSSNSTHHSHLPHMKAGLMEESKVRSKTWESLSLPSSENRGNQENSQRLNELTD